MSILMKKFLKHEFAFAKVKAEQIKEMIRENPLNPEIIVEYYELKKEVEDGIILASDYSEILSADIFIRALHSLNLFKSLDDFSNIDKYLDDFLSNINEYFKK